MDKRYYVDARTYCDILYSKDAVSMFMAVACRLRPAAARELLHIVRPKYLVIACKRICAICEDTIENIEAMVVSVGVNLRVVRPSFFYNSYFPRDTRMKYFSPRSPGIVAVDDMAYEALMKTDGDTVFGRLSRYCSEDDILKFQSQLGQRAWLDSAEYGRFNIVQYMGMANGIPEKCMREIMGDDYRDLSDAKKRLEEFREHNSDKHLATADVFAMVVFLCDGLLHCGGR